MNIELLDSRRLTGPNLYWDLPGALLDVSIGDVSTDVVISAWEAEGESANGPTVWSAGNITSRIYDGGASLIMNVPLIMLYTACELNELALNRVIALLSDQPQAEPDDAITSLSAQADEERNPALLALQSAAADHHVPFLWDDDEVSVGFGKTAIVWPAHQLPSPESIDWPAIGSIPLGIVTGTNGK